MIVKIKRIDPSVPVPEYKTQGAAALDCYVREETTIQPGAIGYAPLNFAVEPPKGHFLLLVARSSLHKRGLMMAHGVGIGDEDFAGDGDEYRAPLYNFSNEPVTVLRGDRVAQLLFLAHERIEWDVVESLGHPDRGGIGSTGT